MSSYRPEFIGSTISVPENGNVFHPAVEATSHAAKNPDSSQEPCFFA